MVIWFYRIFILLTLFSISGCRFTYLVRVDGDKLYRIVNTTCGKLNFELRGKGNHTFSLYQSATASENMEVHFAGLKVLLNSEELNCEIHNEQTGRALNLPFIRLNGDLDISIRFSTDEAVFEGDTILVILDNYIYCDDHAVSIAPLIYQFNR